MQGGNLLAGAYITRMRFQNSTPIFATITIWVGHGVLLPEQEERVNSYYRFNNPRLYPDHIGARISQTASVRMTEPFPSSGLTAPTCHWLLAKHLIAHLYSSCHELRWHLSSI